MTIKMRLPPGVTSFAHGATVLMADEAGIVELESLDHPAAVALVRYGNPTQLDENETGAANARQASKAELAAKLAELGVSVDKRSTAAYLQQLLNDTIAAGASGAPAP